MENCINNANEIQAMKKKKLMKIFKKMLEKHLKRTFIRKKIMLWFSIQRKRKNKSEEVKQKLIFIFLLRTYRGSKEFQNSLHNRYLI